MPPKRTATTTTSMTDAQIKALISQGVVDALEEIKANRTSRNGDDSHDSGSGGRRQVSTVYECTYTDFLKCQPLNFNGTEGVVGLTQWTVGHDVAYEMTWKTLKKMTTDKYYPRGEIKKLEIKLSNLKVKGTDVESYKECFQELALMCGRMFPKESDEVEKYGLGKRNHTEDLNLCALNATTIMMDSVLPSVPNARGLAISPRTVEVSLLLPTTREPKGQIKEFSLALSVELR
ncbi:hypothetical protein Tco_1422061, partial [Tanacetum coccineum]